MHTENVTWPKLTASRANRELQSKKKSMQFTVFSWLDSLLGNYKSQLLLNF